jgi:aldehyde dehydrogenase (NAD+)
MTTFHNFIAGEWVRAASGQTFENRNPADTRDLVGHFPRSSSVPSPRPRAASPGGVARRRRPVAMCCGGSAT